jgi:hypothetical protein
MRVVVELPKGSLERRVLKLAAVIAGLRYNASPGQVEVPTAVFDEIEDMIVELLIKIRVLENKNNDDADEGSEGAAT